MIEQEVGQMSLRTARRTACDAGGERYCMTQAVENKKGNERHACAANSVTDLFEHQTKASPIRSTQARNNNMLNSDANDAPFLFTDLAVRTADEHVSRA